MCFLSVFPGHVPCGKRLTVGYRFPLGPHFGEPFGRLLPMRSFLGEDFLDEESLGEKFMGERHMGEKSVGEKYMVDPSVGEK